MKRKSNLFLILFIGTLMVTNLMGQGSGLVDIRKAEQVITVGGPGADISGYSSKAIQIALDAIETRGGGTVSLSPGIFKITGPVRMPSNSLLTGSGQATVLQKCEGFRTSFIVDADWGMLKAVVRDVSGFETGMGIQLFDDTSNEGWDVTTAIITAIDGNVLYFDNRTNRDYVAAKHGTVSNGCSLVEAVEVENITLSNFRIEGNKKTNDYLNGCRGGGVYIHKSKNCQVINVTVNEFNGDSFSWQIDEDISLKGCEASNGNGLGFHPGTGSNRTTIEDCISHDNTGDGIFLCWRVQNSIFRRNVIYANGDNGISIGHRDTDNVFENNHVFENGHHGVLFREETEANSGHRNTFTGNTVENNGILAESSGFYVGGETHDITLQHNIIRSTSKGNQSSAVTMGKRSSKLNMIDNQITGSAEIIYEKE
jgi:hypothetical protein